MVCKRTKLRFFTNFYNKKQKKLHARRYFLYIRQFLNNENRLQHHKFTPPSKVRQLIRNTAAHILVYRDY